jgi:regulator of cell morphogenesis and NO signaling
MEQITNQETVGEIVKKTPEAASFFRKLDIDFCCGGNLTLKSVCEKKGLKYEDVLKGLTQLGNKGIDTKQLNYEEMSLSFLVDYIYNVHHKYLYENLPEIHFFVDKVYNKHKEKYEWLSELHTLYIELEKDLIGHMPKEENILFPYIKELESKKALTEKPFFGTVKNPLVVMNEEHDRAGEIVHRLRIITNNYTPVADACNSHMVMLANLKELDDDLIQHIHLENNILFPKIVDLEQKFISNN